MSLSAAHPQVTPEYAAVRHILTSSPIAARSAPHIGVDDFDWPALLAEADTMSGGEQLLVRIGYDLWEAKGGVGIWELPRRLDPGNFRRVLAALAICRGDLVTGGPEVLRNAA
jgi:hypothetical protein